MKKVLIVEDDFILMQILMNKFTGAGFQVDSVEDGRSVMDALDSFQPDILMLDIIIPNRNGVEVLKDIRKTQKYSKLPVIVLSNLDDDKIKNDCIRLDISGYYIKSDTSLDVIVSKAKEVVGD